jgi:hypothetical protein
MEIMGFEQGFQHRKMPKNQGNPHSIGISKPLNFSEFNITANGKKVK